MVLAAMHRELEQRQLYLGKEARIETIYFGGGTPSLLSEKELSDLLGKINSLFTVASDAEITLEANPDNIEPAQLSTWHKRGINRLSIGVQSFFDEDLRYMNRAHDGAAAERSIRQAIEAGFDNITMDLIYGTPGLSDAHWLMNLNKARSLGVSHLSCYALTLEKDTPLEHLIRRGKSAPLSEEQSARQFELLMDWAPESGFEQYEISNFAKQGMYSRHNSNYWKGANYLGIGPSAHSFDGGSRQWNIANNGRYVQGLSEGVEYFEREELTAAQQLDEYLLVSLRTMWGCDLQQVKNRFGVAAEERLRSESKPFIEAGDVVLTQDRLLLTRQGKLIADRIASELFV